jgi:ABC-type multidrug transport system ATPase subunit
MGQGPTPVVECAGLGRDFGDRAVLDAIDFSLGVGERLAVTGPNGSGKTTLLRCLAGVLEPTAGGARICGLPPERVAARGRLGAVIGDHRSFYLRLSARENLLLFARLRLGRWRPDGEVAALEEELDLGEIRSMPVARCSTGQIQRLALARSLLGDPAALLLDEPTRSMDERSRALAWDAVDRRSRVAVVLATHDRDEAARCGAELSLEPIRPAPEGADA